VLVITILTGAIDGILMPPGPNVVGATGQANAACLVVGNCTAHHQFRTLKWHRGSETNPRQ
jgi:hypothetical protein